MSGITQPIRVGWPRGGRSGTTVPGWAFLLRRLLCCHTIIPLDCNIAILPYCRAALVCHGLPCRPPGGILGSGWVRRGLPKQALPGGSENEATAVLPADASAPGGSCCPTPQTVNAYYEPTRNEIVFPAAILQPPGGGDPQRRPRPPSCGCAAAHRTLPSF